MVKTSDSVMDINPLERMEKLNDINKEKKDSIAEKKKQLEEFEKQKKKEIDELDKRKAKELAEIEKKKKELLELEQKKVQEIEDTENLIEKSFQDLMKHKKMILEEQDIKDTKTKADQNLEDVAATAKIENDKKNFNSANMYSSILDTLQTPKKIYEITNQNFYNGLTELRAKAARGEITPAEEEFVDKLRSQLSLFEQKQSYMEQDSNNYVKREKTILDQISLYRKNVLI